MRLFSGSSPSVLPLKKVQSCLRPAVVHASRVATTLYNDQSFPRAYIWTKARISFWAWGALHPEIPESSTSPPTDVGATTVFIAHKPHRRYSVINLLHIERRDDRPGPKQVIYSIIRGRVADRAHNL